MATKPAPRLAQMELTAPRAAIYTRVSTDDQAQQGYGLDVQLAKCSAMAQAKGWDVVSVFSDDGISGTLDAARRPGLQALLDAACGGEIDGVLVLALDRLGRSAPLILGLVDRLDKCGVELVSVKESIDSSTPAGRFVIVIMAGLAQLGRDVIVQQTTDGRNQRGMMDGERGGAVPFGYRRVRDETGKAAGVVVVDSEAETVRRIFALRRDGLALRQIAAELNSGPDQTAPRGGKVWYHTAVKVILENEPAYRGGPRGASSERWPVILE